MRHSASDAEATYTPVRKRLILAATVLLSLTLLELGSFMLWTTLVPDYKKKNVEALCSGGDISVTKIPNTFWHHQQNPLHPQYAGQINSKGTIGEEFELPKPEGELRIVCVGDSTVEGAGVKPDETFPYYLEQLLEKHVERWPPYRTVKVINGGIGAHNSAFNLAYLAFRLIHFHPDIVVIKSAYNDYLPYLIPGLTYDYTHAFPNPYHRVSSSSSPWYMAHAYWLLARFSYFLKTVGLIAFKGEVSVPFPDFSGHISSEQFQSVDYLANADKFFVYAENIRSMILLCKGRGIDVVLLDLPTSPNLSNFGTGHVFGARFKGLIQRLEAEGKRIANEQAVQYVSTGPFDANDFWDHCHCTASGNKKVAEAVAPAIVKSMTPSGNAR
jgi:hypothetical protein